MTLQENHSQAIARLVHGTPISVPLSAVAANSLIALFCLADADDGNATESLSIGTSGGLTWTRAVQANGSPGACVAVFTAPFAAGGSITPTVVDSDGMADASAEIGVIPVIFTDTNGGIPGVGATATGTGITSITTTVANSWVWGAGFGQGIDDANQTRIFSTSGGSFDGGDDINVAKENATTSTPGTIVSLTLGALHTAIIEIKPGVAGGPSDVTVADNAPAAALAALWTEAISNGVVLKDAPSAGLAHVQPPELAGSATIVFDTPSAAVAASVAETVVSDTIVADNAPTAALAGLQADSVAIGVTITDAPAGSVAGAVSETAAIGTAVNDTISASLAGIPRDTTTSGTVIADAPAASLAAGPLAFEGFAQGTFIDGSAVLGALAAAWQETVSLGVPVGDIAVSIREARVASDISLAVVSSHVALAVVATGLAEASVSVDIKEADVTSHVRG